MSEVSDWIVNLGKAFVAYKDVFEENGVVDLDTLGQLDVDDMVTDLSIKRTHARIISYRWKKEFGTKTESVAPSVVKITEKSKVDYESSKKKIKVVALKDLKGVFRKKEMFEELSKLAQADDIVAKALSLLNEQLSYILKLREEPPTIKYRGFLSHVQHNSADLCRCLFYGLEKKHTSVWYDMTAGRLDARGMVEGIATCSYFVLIATKDSFSRPWPLFELLIAQILRKPMIVALEADSRHGGLTFEAFMNLVPKPWDFLKSHEIMKIERRGDFWPATVNELHKRLSKETISKQMDNCGTIVVSDLAVTSEENKESPTSPFDCSPELIIIRKPLKKCSDGNTRSQRPKRRSSNESKKSTAEKIRRRLNEYEQKYNDESLVDKAAREIVSNESKISTKEKILRRPNEYEQKLNDESSVGKPAVTTAFDPRKISLASLKIRAQIPSTKSMESRPIENKGSLSKTLVKNTAEGSPPSPDQDKTKKLVFQPGTLGLKAYWCTGEVEAITPNEQCEDRVEIGWRLVKVDDEEYTEETLDARIEGDKEYTITFRTEPKD